MLYCFSLCIGASHYGIGDLGALASDTHKFESRYLDGLLLPMDDPNADALLKERSPIYHTDKLNCPIALFQGDQDKVCWCGDGRGIGWRERDTGDIPKGWNQNSLSWYNMNII